MVVAVSGLLLVSIFFANCQGHEILIRSSVNKSGIISGCLSSSPESCVYKFQREEDHSLILRIESKKLPDADNAKNVKCNDTNELWLDGGPIFCNISADNFTICQAYRRNKADCVGLCSNRNCSCEDIERDVSIKFTNSTSKAAVVLWRYTINFQYVKCSAASPTRYLTSNGRSPTTQLTAKTSFSASGISSKNDAIRTTSKGKSMAKVTTESNENTGPNQISTDQGVGKTTESPPPAVITYVIPVAAAIVIIIAVIAAVFCIRKRKSSSYEAPINDSDKNTSEKDVYACVNKKNVGSKTTVRYTKETVDNELYGTAP